MEHKTAESIMTGVFITVIGGVIIALIFASKDLRTTTLKQQAIEHGYAHYSTDTRGNTTFEWNDKAKLP